MPLQRAAGIAHQCSRKNNVEINAGKTPELYSIGRVKDKLVSRLTKTPELLYWPSKGQVSLEVNQDS